MKKGLFILVMSTMFFLGSSLSAFATVIFFDVVNLGGNAWEYNYEVNNDTLSSDIEDFTVWFDYGLYQNLAVTSPLIDWSEFAVEPALVLGSPDDGFYDAFALTTPIVPGATESGFSVSFNWVGPGTPGSQFFEIIDPATWQASDSGFTTRLPPQNAIPEPATILLSGPGLFLLGLFKRKFVF